MRKILEERLENAKLNYKALGFKCDELLGEIRAYQDCLNLLPPKRTEQEILKDFEALGYRKETNNRAILLFKTDTSKTFETCIYIDLQDKNYRKQEFTITEDITMQEHKLLNELFEVWQWI